MEVHGLERVAIVDFDVHHGNGTEDIFSGDERVLFCSSFEHPLYPGSGADSKAVNVVNVPLPGSTDSMAYREAVFAAWPERLRAFEPQLLLFSAGFDGHQADDISHMQSIDDDYAWLTQMCCKAVAQSTQDRVVSVLEGGYELHALARSVEAHLNAMMNDHS